MTVREWFRQMRHGDAALTFAADIDEALRQMTPVYIRVHRITLVFDLENYKWVEAKYQLVRRLKDITE